METYVQNMHLLITPLHKRQLGVHGNPITWCQGDGGRDEDQGNKCDAMVARPVKCHTLCFTTLPGTDRRAGENPRPFCKHQVMVAQHLTASNNPGKEGALTTVTTQQ